MPDGGGWESAVIGGGFGLVGQALQNSANEDAATTAFERSQISAQKQMDFQKDMYQHRYQMQTQDMIAAGLNPMLAAGASPGSAPSGASATAPVAQVGNVIGAGLNSAMQGAQTAADLKAKDASAAVDHAQKALLEKREATEMFNAYDMANRSDMSKIQKEIAESNFEKQLKASNIRADTDLKQAHFENSTQSFRNINKLVNEGLDTANSAMDLTRQGHTPSRGYQDEHYDQNGEFRGMRQRNYLPME